jgi:hypothetical protein
MGGDGREGGTAVEWNPGGGAGVGVGGAMRCWGCCRISDR